MFFKSQAAEDIFKRYLLRNERGAPCESVEDSFRRVAWNICAYDHEPEAFYQQLLPVMLAKEFVPNRPSWYGLGRGGLTSACTFFAMEDSLIEGDRSIMATLRKGVAVQQAGGGVGWDVSELRPAGALIKGSGGRSTGPIGFIEGINHFLAQVEQGGRMMGANNVSLSVKHPDALEFIRLKLQEEAITQFNTNLLVDDQFMSEPDPELWDALIDAMWVNGGIGVQFIDTANAANAIPGYGPLRGTNPCSEFWMFSGESCQPSYVNVRACVRAEGTFDWNKLARLTRIGVRAMDNHIDANGYLSSVPELRRMALATRRMGVGPTGLADALVLMGIRYGSEDSLAFAAQMSEFMLYHALSESIALSRIRGSFPLFYQSVYATSAWQRPQGEWGRQTHIAGLLDFGRPALDWAGVECEIGYGIRNCGVTVVAPSSFGSQTMETEGYGCEPIFAPNYVRNHGDGGSHEYGSELAQMPAFVAAHEVTPQQHVQMVAALQPNITESISKTVNLPFTATHEDVAQIVKLAWMLGLKNVTVYRAQSRQAEALVKTPCKECSVDNECAV